MSKHHNPLVCMLIDIMGILMRNVMQKVEAFFFFGKRFFLVGGGERESSLRLVFYCSLHHIMDVYNHVLPAFLFKIQY